jgi:hypothetical protein
LIKVERSGRWDSELINFQPCWPLDISRPPFPWVLSV